MLRELRDLFYPYGKKIVPDNIGDLLDLQAIAVWYMDDGTGRLQEYQWRSGARAHAEGRVTATPYVALYTNCFERKGQELLQAAIFQHIGVKPVIASSGGSRPDQLYLRFSSDAAHVFLDALRPYSHPSMLYKFPKSVPAFSTCAMGHSMVDPNSYYTSPNSKARRCRLCRDEARAVHYSQNRDKAIAGAKAWYEAHRERRGYLKAGSIESAQKQSLRSRSMWELPSYRARQALAMQKVPRTLSRSQADEIRTSTARGIDLAKIFGVSPQTISEIRHGKAYK